MGDEQTHPAGDGGAWGTWVERIEHLEAENQRLRAAYEDAERHADLRQMEVERLQELLDAYATAHDRLVAGACTAPDRAADGEAFDAAQEAILAAATKENDHG